MHASSRRWRTALACALVAGSVVRGSPVRAQGTASPSNAASVAPRTTGSAVRADGPAWSRWAFEGRRYYDPAIAEPRAAHVNALAVGFMREVAFLQERGDHRRAWDIDLGAELPLFGFERGASTAGRPAEGATGVGLWFAVDFHMLEDFPDPSAPILNTDYRFSGIVKAQHGLGPTSWLGLRLQVGHESTHLGDEYSLAASRLFPDFERVNVSWEYLDAGLSYEWQGATGGTSTTRAGVITTLPFGDSYYKADTLETGGREIPESANSLEPYLQVQHRRDSFCAGAGTQGRWCRAWGAYASLDARLKTVYDYRKQRASDAEARQPSVNVILGIARRQRAAGTLGNASPYLRAYGGVNPHGQFRDQRHWFIYGLGLRLDH